MIRTATLADAAGLAELERCVFDTDRISLRSFRRLIAAQTARTLIASAGGRILGYAVLLFRRGAGMARLYSIAVSPEAAGLGVGGRLLEACEKLTLATGRKRLRLEVSRNNLRAIALYRKNGFVQFGVHRSYYGDGSDALRFEKQLCGECAPIQNDRSA